MIIALRAPAQHPRCARSLARALGGALRGTQRRGNGTAVVVVVGHDYGHVPDVRGAAQQQHCSFARCKQMRLNPAMQMLLGRSTAVQGSAVGRIKAFKGHHIASQPPFDVQQQIEGTQLQLWQQQQQAPSAAAPATGDVGGG